MEKTLASRVQSANAVLIANGDLDAVGEYFTQDYLVHLMYRDMAGAHKVVRDSISMLRGSFPASKLQIVWRDMVTSQFHDGLIKEEWLLTDLAEQLLLSKKR